MLLLVPYALKSDIPPTTLPHALHSVLEHVEAGEGGPGEERVLRRYASDSRAEVRLAARVGMSQSLRGRGQAREALPWVEEYAGPTEENLAWPRIRGLLEATRVRAALGQTYDAVSRLNRAREFRQNLTGSNYSIISFDKGADVFGALGLGPPGGNSGNENPNVEIRVFNPAIRLMLVDLFEDLIYTNGDNPEYPEVPQPYVKINHMANAVAFVAIHEVGHGLGLVADNDVLDGSSHSHNKPPFPNEVNIMDPGHRRDPDFYYFVDTWSWRETNFKYLEFILPTQ